MQAFFPYPSISESAKVLDNRRLVSQTWEARMMLNAISGTSSAWANHCVTRFWRRSPSTLLSLWAACSTEAATRGLKGFAVYDNHSDIPDVLPSWTLDELPDFCTRYKQHLFAKKPDHYHPFFGDTPAISGYWGLNKNGQYQLYSLTS
jgi:hypothetical protein